MSGHKAWSPEVNWAIKRVSMTASWQASSEVSGSQFQGSEQCGVIDMTTGHANLAVTFSGSNMTVGSEPNGFLYCLGYNDPRGTRIGRTRADLAVPQQLFDAGLLHGPTVITGSIVPVSGAGSWSDPTTGVGSAITVNLPNVGFAYVVPAFTKRGSPAITGFVECTFIKYGT